MEDKRIQIIVKGEQYPLIDFLTIVDVDNKRLHCKAIVSPKTKTPRGSTLTYEIQGPEIGFYVPIQFDKTTKENLARAGLAISEHVS